MIDLAVIMMFIKLISEGVGVASEIADIAKRLNAGEEITLEEIQAARKVVDDAVAGWDAERARRDGSNDS